jgi:16S rRNA (adenine(1408)-N(1))-methyltransferase
VIVDIGTGDGRAVIERARREPTALVIGVDAAAAAMADASRRAERRGPHNALFLAEGAERLAASPLARTADFVTITFPWGSLLRGVVGLDDAAMTGVAAILGQAGRIAVLASVVPADGIDGFDCLDEAAAASISAAWRRAGVDLTSMRPATADEITESGSTWSRRLRTATPAGNGEERRPVWRLDGRRLG